MNHNETRGTVIKVVDISSGGQTLNTLKKNDSPTFTVGGIFSDFELAWLYCGAYLKVINISDGTVQSTWDFSSIIRDNKAQITSVIEYEISDNSNRTHSKEVQLCLIVSYTSVRDSNKASYISFCHPRTSKILHTITTKEKVTCMSLISSKKDHSCPLTGIVKLMSGALAVGTKSGNILIVDIKGYELINELYSCSRKPNVCDFMPNRVSCMLILDIKQYSEGDIKDKICKVDDDNYHVAISIPVSERKDCHSYDSEISSIMYIPQGLTLAVGFRSGVFQLWDVSSLKKLYKSSSLSVPTPIVKFGFQEPCNDPQSFCYLWVLHESKSDEDPCVPFAVMYGILYKKVVVVPDYGRCYKSFTHCKKRFDMDIDMERSLNGRCIASSVVSNTPSNMLRHISTNEEDPSKINLFVMVFETWENRSDINSRISLVVFDMNQWYKAQMPHQCYNGYNGYSVPFINFVLLDRVSEQKSTILDMRIKKDTIQQFLTFNLSEEYSYPSSLSFDTVFLSNIKLIYLRIPGIQRCIIERIVAEGPNGLLKPSKYFSECKEVGLRPCFSDNYGQVIVPSQIQQRNYILTILLEHKMSNFLVRCIDEWADGSRSVVGCTLSNLVQWAWDCVARIKQFTDTICIPLFDYSGDDLDRENYQKLKHCCQLLQLIRDLLSYTSKNFKQYLLDCKKLDYQIETLQLVTKYFNVIVWCLDVKLLPEKVTSTSDRCIPTYMINLMQFTEQRREELKVTASKDKYFSTEDNTLYIIDAVLDKEPGGRALRQQWERESCGMTNGFYPPVTLQSLLRMFLMPNLSIDTKHFIAMYFLLDVCDYHRDEDIKEQLLSFSVIFFSDFKFSSLIEACWLIDHEKFEEAADILLSDVVIGLLKKNRNLYETILKSCVCQGQYALALKCKRIIKLPVSFQNRSFHITLLLLNGLTMEAYSALRDDALEDIELLRNFFKICDELGFLKEVFKFPLLPEEEVEFLSYLDRCNNKDAGDLKVMYLLSRGRYAEAVDINHSMSTKVPRFPVVGKDTEKQGSSGRTTTRDLLVNAFSKTLPNVTNDLISFCRKERDKIYRHKHVAKPTPLSAVLQIDVDKQVPVYKSSFESVMQAAICKTAETWSNFPKIDSCNRNSSFVQNTPFLRSQLLAPKHKRSDISFRNSQKNKTAEEKKKDPDEPPAKKMRRSIDVSSNHLNETNNDDSLHSAPLEVSKILRTPHVQKRLNKLLQNTPESSPLTSILKSSEISRFKQPQKVGFNVPERHRSTPQRRADVTNDISTPTQDNRAAPEELRVKKSLVEDFEKSQETAVQVEIENETDVKTNANLRESLDSVEKDDSYYSLESANDDENVMSFVVDEPKNKNDVRNVSTKLFIECMSDEDIEITSQVESPNDSQVPSGDVECRESHPNNTAAMQELEPMEVGETTYETVNMENMSFTQNEQTEGEINTPVGVITTVRGSHFDEEFYSREYANVNAYAMESYQENVEEVENVNENSNRNVENVPDYGYKYDSNVIKKDSESESEYSDEDMKSHDEEHDDDEEDDGDERRNSVTEITDSSEEDSDIEVIEDNAVPVIQTSFTSKNDDADNKQEDVNVDQLSEGTYESEYTYSDESVGEELEIEEQSVVDEENNVYVDDSNDADEYERSSPDNQNPSENEEHEILQNDPPQINYEQLKEIVSTITAAENKAIDNNMRTINETYVKEVHHMGGFTEDTSVLNTEPDLNDTAEANASVSVCEVYDATQSILEETVNLSDVKNQSVENESVEVIGDMNYSVVNVSGGSSNKNHDEHLNYNTETEPSMVFYFGENSVASIGDDVLGDERDLSNKIENENDNDQDEKREKDAPETSDSSGDQSMDNDVNKCENFSTQDMTKFSVAEESTISVKCTSVKEHNFLRTSMPECNVHIIEKVRNEMYSSDDGYDDSDVQVDQAADENLETRFNDGQTSGNLTKKRNKETGVVENLTNMHQSANQSCVIVRESEEKSPRISELISENDITVDVSIVQMSQNAQITVSPADKNERNMISISQSEEKTHHADDLRIRNESIHADLETPTVEVQSSELPGVAEKRTSDEFHVTSQPVVEVPLFKQSFLATEAESSVRKVKEIENSDESTKRRRSVRIAKRRSIDSIAGTPHADVDLDDSASIKSESSLADSYVSNATVCSESSTHSNKSQRKKSKPTSAQTFKKLEVIMSDEELNNPEKTDVHEVVNKTFKPKYSSSEPDSNRVTTKRKRYAKSELDIEEDESISVSESGDRNDAHKRNVRRKSDLITESSKTPKPNEKRFGRFVSSTPLILDKVKSKPTSQASSEIEKYASSRRLTRSQKLYMEYGFMNTDINTVQMSPSTSTGARRKKLENIEEHEEYSLSIDENVQNIEKPKVDKKADDTLVKPILTDRKVTPRKEKTSVQPTRFSKRLSGRFSPQINDDSISSEEPPSPAKSVSSVAESTSSKASTASRRSQRKRRTYTSMELRRSSVKPNFKPLAVIPSDDENQSFQLPTPTKTVVDDSFHSSSESTFSKASATSKSKRKVTEISDVSDESSSVSDASNITTSSIGSRKRVVKKHVKTTDSKDSTEEKSGKAALYPSNRRLTRNQKSKVEMSMPSTSKKKK